MTPDDIVVTRWGSRFMGRHFPCAIGKGGLTHNKREGDGATPIGIHRIAGFGYRPDRMNKPFRTALALGPSDLWSDDVRDEKNYNQHVRAPYGYSHENLRRADPLYDLIILTDWNYPEATPGKGSAIFIHSWRKPRHPTEGCVAFRPDHLMWIVQNLRDTSRLIVRG